MAHSADLALAHHLADLTGRQRIDTGSALFARRGLHSRILDVLASAG